MPIQPTQQMVNLVITHVLSTLPLAWERAESYIMAIPPRPVKADLVLSRELFLFRWLPFVVYFPLIVCSCVTLSVYSDTGFWSAHALVPTSQASLVSEGLAACEIAGTLDADKSFVP